MDRRLHQFLKVKSLTVERKRITTLIGFKLDQEGIGRKEEKMEESSRQMNSIPVRIECQKIGHLDIRNIAGKKYQKCNKRRRKKEEEKKC